MLASRNLRQVYIYIYAYVFWESFILSHSHIQMGPVPEIGKSRRERSRGDYNRGTFDYAEGKKVCRLLGTERSASLQRCDARPWSVVASKVFCCCCCCWFAIGQGAVLSVRLQCAWRWHFLVLSCVRHSLACFLLGRDGAREQWVPWSGDAT